MWPFSSDSHHSVIIAKRAERERALARAKSISHELNEFTRATATEIVSRIEKGEWTASQVIEAYISRAAFAQATTNCLTEVMFDWARKQAKELDDEFATTKKLRGPLHGVPTSFKDQFNIIGFDTTLGFTQWANKPATENGILVNQLLAAGAVVLAKTNIPQTLFAFECRNPLWGRSTHPLSSDYTSGGSSGGEGALLSMGGSAIGIGSDIAGSLRVPAAYCGIYSLKPAVGRMSHVGGRGPNPGFEGINVVVGPMGRSIEDLETVSRLVFGAQAPAVVPLPFREANLPQKLRFGYYTSDGYVKASPACKRAVLETIEALRREGHECIEFDLPYAGQAFNIFMGLTSADGYKLLFSHLGSDPKEESLLFLHMVPKMPAIVRRIVTWVMETFYNDKILADTVRATRPKSVFDYTKIVAERLMLVGSFNKEVWGKHNFDGIIGPVQAVPQLPNGGGKYFNCLIASTVLYNVLDSPVGCVPVTRVDPARDQVTKEWSEGPGLGSAILEGGLYRGKNPLYNPSEMEGMPVGIQIIGKKWQEEKVLAMMRVVDEALGKDRGFGPGEWKQRVPGVAAKSVASRHSPYLTSRAIYFTTIPVLALAFLFNAPRFLPEGVLGLQRRE